MTYPHKRILLAASAFSGSLGLLLAIYGFVLMLYAIGTDDPNNDGAVRGAGLLTFFIAPGVAIFSSVLTIPTTYLGFRWRPRSFDIVAVWCAVVAVVIGIFLCYKGAGIAFTLLFIIPFFIMPILTPCAYIWWRLLPDPNPLPKPENPPMKDKIQKDQS